MKEENRNEDINHMDKRYHSKNPFVKYIHTKRLEIIKELVGDNKGRLLECGCGEGHLLEELRGDKYGIDLSPSLIRAKDRNQDAEILKGDITNLPFDDGFFDIVVCTETLEHIPNYKKAASEIKRVTKGGGVK